ncbi:ABC transporter substrate-binding protein [Vulcanisaeta thermophila]|uniref:ABC transporter substrate-binding protein n=1 Tax=Vulcanisaeta thermophila TaxID=867917 RepID=UPI000853ABB6|nr:ABC transporter substrate-binding protein [Vulcanisaeta thermophila]
MTRKVKTISRQLLLLTVVTILLISTITMLAIAQQAPPMPQVINVYEVPRDQIPQYFSTGKIDVFLNPWAIPPNILTQLQQNPNITFVSPGLISGYDLLFNPYPSNTTFNPFAYWQVRFLMNYLVDRERIVTEVFLGNAMPMQAWPGLFALYSQLLIQNYVAGFNIHYDPTFANQSLYNFFVQLNKTDPVWHGRILYINHKWYYIPPNSTTPQPVTIIFFIRQDDVYRYQMGQIFSAELQNLGFTVKPIYGDLRQAYAIVYGSNPADMQWQIYTEAWSITPTPWDTGAGASFCASWTGDMPGWGEPGFWQYTNDTIDKLTLWVASGNFTSLDQFKEYSTIALEDCFQQAVRVWIVARAAPYPIIKGYSNYLSSVLGLETPWGVKFSYVQSHPNVLNVGMLHVSQRAWVPIGWFSPPDAYTIDLVQGWLTDPFGYYSPFSGEPMPYRGSWKVVINLQNSAPQFPVPPNAVVWNATLGKWVPVGPGKMARAVVYLYFNGTWLGTKWQDGSPITMADVVFYYYLLFDLAQLGPDLGPYASNLADLQGIVQPTVQQIIGMQFFPNGTVVIYSNYWFPDPNIVAAYFAPMAYTGIDNPWYVYAASLELFKEGKAAFTSSEATAMHVPQLDLASHDLAAEVANVIKSWASSGYIWDNGAWAVVDGYDFINTTLAVQEYNNALSFFNTYGNMYISNGPYILKQLITTAPQSAQLVLWSGYPFSYAYWFNKLYASQGITTVPSSVTPVVLSVTPTSIYANTTATLTVSMSGVGYPQAYVYLINPQGKVVYTTFVNSTTPGTLTIVLNKTVTSKLTPGTYQLMIYAFTNLVTVPYQYTTSLVVSPPPINVTAPTKPTAPTPVSTTVIIAIVVIVIIIIVAIVAWLMVRRRR